MNKKFLNAVLFGALIASSAGTFTSCKDYDDDIKSLQEQIDKSGSTVGDLQTQLLTLQRQQLQKLKLPQTLQRLPVTKLLPMLLPPKFWLKKQKLLLRKQKQMR